MAALALLGMAPLPAAVDLAAIRGLIRSGRYAEAIAACDQELKTAPGSAPLYTLKGLALQAAGGGDRSPALAAFRKALALQPAYPPALQAAAQLEFETRDPRAAQTLEAVLRLDPASEPAHAMLASLLFEKRDCVAAVPHFEKVQRPSPSMQWQYGVCLLARERWAEAAAQFESLVKLREQHAPTRYNLGLAYWNAKDYRAAVAALAPVADGPSADSDMLRLYAASLESVGDTPKAFDVMQRAIRSNPRDERLLIDLAILCMDHKNLDLGLELVEIGIQASPASARLQTLKGVLLVRRGDLEKGQESFRLAQKLSPQEGLGYIGLASAMMQMGLASEAVKLLREQAPKSDMRAALTLARALLLQSPVTDPDVREAIALLEQIVKQEPGNAVAYGLLGKAQMQSGGDPRKAETALASAIRLDPADRVSTYQLMLLYRKSGRTSEAAALARKVQALVSKEAEDEAAGSRFHVLRESETPR